MLRNDERRSVAPFARQVPHDFWLVETLADTILRRSHWTARFVVILADRKSEFAQRIKDYHFRLLTPSHPGTKLVTCAPPRMLIPSPTSAPFQRSRLALRHRRAVDSAVDA